MSGEGGRKKQSDRTAHLSYEENICHTYACAIQQCLKRKQYDEKKCRKEIERWKKCLAETKPDDPRDLQGDM